MDQFSRSHPTLTSNERGLALAMALFAILVIGALVTGIFFAGRMEMVSGRNSVYIAQATEAAEKGLADAFSGWNTAWNGYPVDSNGVQPTQTISGATNVRYTNTVRRLLGGNYLITSVGEKLDQSGNVVASRLLARLGKLIPTSIDIKAAITSGGSPSIGGSFNVSGINTTPPAWAGCPGGPDVAAVRSDQPITKSGSASWSGIPALPSQPIIQNDTTVTAGAFTGPYNSFVAGASINFPSSSGPTLTGVAPTVTGSPSRCDTSNTSNWGEPNYTGSPVTKCQHYFPIVHFANAPGNANKVHISGGRGEGVILVDGDVQLDGGLQFEGIVIALGNVDVQGNGTKIWGVVFGQSVSAGTNSFSGTAQILYSSCAAQVTLNFTAPGFALNERSWAQVNPR
jgi:hypothetical protein